MTMTHSNTTGTDPGGGHIPRGFTALQPYLIIDRADQLRSFLLEALDGEEVMCLRDERGEIQHAAMRIGGAMLEYAQACGEWKPMPGGLHHYVPSVDDTYRRCLEAGATSIHEPRDMFYGERSAGVVDPAGNHWYLATLVEELDQEEIEQRQADYLATLGVDDLPEQDQDDREPGPQAR